MWENVDFAAAGRAKANRMLMTVEHPLWAQIPARLPSAGRGREEITDQQNDGMDTAPGQA